MQYMASRLHMLHILNSENSTRVDFPNVKDSSYFGVDSSVNSTQVPSEQLQQNKNKHLSTVAKDVEFSVYSSLLKAIFGQIVVPITDGLREWLVMQTRWVVWTLAAHERRFPALHLGQLLTRNSVLQAVFQRYQAYVYGTVDNNIAIIQRQKYHGKPQNNGINSTGSTSDSSRCRRFGCKQGSMSPLQKAADIHVLRWPLVVCIAIKDSVRAESEGLDTNDISINEYKGELSFFVQVLN